MIPAPLPLTIRAGTAFGPMTITCQQADGSAFNLTGWTAYAYIKSEPGAALFYDLNPSVTNAAGGIVTIPQIDDAVTLAFTLGTYHWDLILKDGTGEKYGPFIEGVVTIKLNITEPL